MEERPGVAYLLTFKQAGAPGLIQSVPDNSGNSVSGSLNGISFKNAPISSLIVNLQLNSFSSFDKPIIDRTGLTGKFDITLDWTPGPGEKTSDAIVRAFRDQLGLNLALNSEPIPVVVVEKAR